MGSAATGPGLLPTQSQSVPSGSGSYAQAHLSCGQKSAASIRSCFPYVKERSLEVTAINNLRPLRSYIEKNIKGAKQDYNSISCLDHNGSRDSLWCCEVCGRALRL